jgi:serine O-acetyltransferase
MTVTRLWATSRWLYQRRMTRTSRVVKFVNFLLYKALLPAEGDIASDVKLKHHGMGVVMHPNVTIGPRVTIYHHVTIAGETWIGSPHRVVVESDVTIGVGAKIIPRINCGLRIGKGAVIGAGAVVTKDVPAFHIAVGVPATFRPIRSANDEGEKPA